LAPKHRLVAVACAAALGLLCWAQRPSPIFLIPSAAAAAAAALGSTWWFSALASASWILSVILTRGVESAILASWAGASLTCLGLASLDAGELGFRLRGVSHWLSGLALELGPSLLIPWSVALAAGWMGLRLWLTPLVAAAVALIILALRNLPGIARQRPRR